MDETAVKEQEQQQAAGSTTSSGSLIGKSKLRYPLRSSMKLKEEKPPAVVADSTTSSSSGSSKRRRQASSVSKSLGVLDHSAKEKSVKPPRRQSIPTKTIVGTPYPKLSANIKTISETRSKRNGNQLGKSETPLSDASRASVRRTFNRISSASYWLSQIKLSESAAKHSVSLGFFKLALEAGCEPLQQIRDELKSYVRRFELGELEASKELFEKYNISVNPEQQVQVSVSHSQATEEGSRSSEEDINSSSPTVGTMNLRPRSLNTAATDDGGKKESVKKEAIWKKNAPSTKSKPVPSLSSKGTVNSKPVSGSSTSKVQKKPQKQIKSEAGKVKNQVKKAGKKSSAKEEVAISLAAADSSTGENKENMDERRSMEDVSVSEVV